MAVRKTSIFRLPFGPRIKQSRVLKKRYGIGYGRQLKSGAYIYEDSKRFINPLKGGQLKTRGEKRRY